ncbi:hypothetical protein Taro_024461 [Colocasia esculenta]|uniref:Uncharacterized protein n=1 Tax=Colocasia esculenta TaxID=4460 RepID=A0A843V7I1_COLES|nr:hypothetical protein [Colocasia esculenta]
MIIPMCFKLCLDRYQLMEKLERWTIWLQSRSEDQVDTRSRQVDTRSRQVDTRSSQVDTRPSFQQISLPDWDSRLTLDQVDTREPSQKACLPDWDSRSTLDQGRSTLDQIRSTLDPLAGNGNDWHSFKRPLDGHDWRGGFPLSKCAQYFDNDRHARNIILSFKKHAWSQGFLLLTLVAPQIFAPAPLDGGGCGWSGRLYGGVGVVGGVMVGGGLIMEGLLVRDGNVGGVGKWRTNMTSEGSSS